MNFSQILLKWYEDNHRDLPWRNTRDPYAIWLSEVILQQTRVEQGMPYWYRFLDHFPTVIDLANADEQLVLRLWQGLGYYSRARNLHAAAKMVRDLMGGKFPSKYEQIKSLKGIGDYTAAAIASIAFDLPHAVVDGNVYRFLSRLFGIETPIDSTKGKKEFFELANSLLDKKHPGLFNQATMEFGAVLCKPANPTCNVCPFSLQCKAFQSKSINAFPVKSKKTKTRNRYFDFILLSDEKNILIEQRKEKDIWQGLYQFPLIESASKNKSAILDSDLKGLALNLNSFELIKASTIVKHVLSHQIIFAKFWWISLKALPKQPSNYICISTSDLGDFGMPQLIVKYLNEVDFS
ncbi:MAG: A/G-specific adenine glycosylase [Bacteroidota bacterium]